MVIGSYLLRRGQTYYFRCRIPNRLRDRTARRDIVRSLGTRLLAVARIRAAELALAANELWMQIEMTGLSEEIEALIDAWFKTELERAWAPLGRGTFASDVLPPGLTPEQINNATRRMFADEAHASLEALAVSARSGDFSGGRPAAKAILSQMSIPVSESARLFEVVCRAIVAAEAQIYDARVRWAGGEVDFTPSRRPEPIPVAPAPVVKPLLPIRTISESIVNYLDLKRLEPDQIEKTIVQTSGELSVLEFALGGDRDIRDVGHAEAGEIYEAMRFLPAGFRNHPKLRGLPFPVMVSTARSLSLKPLHPRTANGYLSTMRAMLDNEVRSGRLLTNPFAGKNVPEPHQQESKRAFTTDELTAILSNPLFIGAKSEARPYDPGSSLINNWRFWATIIALLTGARIAEIMQLTPADIRTAQGCAVIDINSDGDKRLKTPGSARLIPVHSELVRIGLLKLAETQLSAGRLRLLPEAPQAVLGDHGKQASQWMSEKFLPKLKIRRDHLGFHSFRHGMATMLREVDVDSRNVDRLLGHTSSGMGARYGTFGAKLLDDQLKKIQLPPDVARIPSRY